MVTDDEFKQFENFIDSYGYFYTTRHDDYIFVKGTFDDLNPEPERSEVEQALSKLKQDIAWNDEGPLSVEKVSDIESRYGEKRLKIYVK